MADAEDLKSLVETRVGSSPTGGTGGIMPRIDYFHSNNVSWKQGFFNLQKATWHSCMQWGWPSINRGEHPEEWCEYWVLSFKIGTRGWSWQWWPWTPLYRKNK